MGKGNHKSRKNVDIATLYKAGDHNVDDSYYYNIGDFEMLNETIKQIRRNFLIEKLFGS